MPRFSGTGPAGMGPMTGWGRGPCNSAGAGWRRRDFPRYGRSYGVYPVAPWVYGQQDAETLKNQAKALRAELKGLESEIEKLSAEKDKNS